MKKIEICIPEDKKSKNSAFSFCVSFLRDFIKNDTEFEGKMKPLGDIELISEFNLLNEINKNCNTSHTIGDLEFLLRDFKRATGLEMEPIHKYKNVSKSQVYMKSDLDEFLKWVSEKIV